MAPALWRLVCGIDVPTYRATLSGYARLAVRGETFPGIVPRTGEKIAGLLKSDLNELMWARLDAFETDFYQRCSVAVMTEDGIEHRADTYVVVEDKRHLLVQQPWSYEHFVKQNLSKYLEPTC